MPRDGFVLAVSPKGQKRRVPKSWLEEPFNYKLPPSARGKSTAGTEDVSEQAKKETTPKEVKG